MFHQEHMEDANFLPALTQALAVAAQCDPPKTTEFKSAVDKVLPVFEHLGSVLAFAKSELQTKNDSLQQKASKSPTLKDIVDVDKKAKSVTTKNSGARNLHRLRTAILFIQQLLKRLIDDPHTTLSVAASAAYADTLSPYHTSLVRGTVTAGFAILPSRATFLANIKETEESVTPAAKAFIATAQKICDSIDRLYDGPMPASTAWF